MHDVAIIGAGPAGITAAVYAARKKLRCVVFAKMIGGQAAWSGEVGNYTGYQYISGQDLAKKFEEHMKSFEVELEDNAEVSAVQKKEGIFVLKTGKDEFQAKSVIIATGRKPKLLKIPGEKEFRNRGVTYCATCDGPLFSGRDVAVIGAGNSALDSAIQMSSIASKVYLINRSGLFIGEGIRLEKLKAMKNVEILLNAKTEEIIGSKFVESIRLFYEGEEKVIAVGGVFIEIGSTPNLVLVKYDKDQLEVNEHNEIVVDSYCRTNIPGLFAAGDVTDVPYKQIVVAAGQGAIASLSAFDYITKLRP